MCVTLCLRLIWEPQPVGKRDGQTSIRRTARAIPQIQEAHGRRARAAGDRAGGRDRAVARGDPDAWALSAGRRAGAGEDADGLDAGRDHLAELQAHPVHARPDALGHHRHQRDRRATRRQTRVPFRAGTGVRQHLAGRRDQPHASQGRPGPGASPRGRASATRRSRCGSSCSATSSGDCSKASSS